MNKKNILLVIFFALLVGAIYYLAKQDDKQSTLNLAETEFAVPDTASVTKIFISTKKGTNNLLERKSSDEWIVNKRYPASQSLVNTLLETVHQMQVKRPVAKQARNQVIRTLATQGIKVEIYNRDGLLKTFYVGGNTQDEKGSYFLMNNSETPYVLHIRGFEGYLSSRFTLEEKEWRSRQLFASTPNTIQEISYEYPDEPKSNFRVVRSGNGFTVNEVSKPDTLLLKQFVNSFSNLFAEQYITPVPQRFSDSISLLKPTVIITLKDANPKLSNKLTIFPNPNDQDRMVAKAGLQQADLLTVQNYTFGRLLLKKSDFSK